MPARILGPIGGQSALIHSLDAKPDLAGDQGAAVHVFDQKGVSCCNHWLSGRVQTVRGIFGALSQRHTASSRAQASGRPGIVGRKKAPVGAARVTA